MTGQRASGTVITVNPSASGVRPSVDVALLGAIVRGLRYPAWYTPRVNDVVVIEWLGSQPYVATAFA